MPLMRFLIVDTYYGQFLESLYSWTPGLSRQPYEHQWRTLMDQCFGTADYYSSNLTQLGHEAADVVANCEPLQTQWAREHGVWFGNGLVFFEYDERRAQGLRSKYWQETVLGAYRHRNQDLFYRNLDIFNSCLEWKGGFDVTVFRLGQSLPTLRPFRAQAGEPATSAMP